MREYFKLSLTRHDEGRECRYHNDPLEDFGINA